jgi:glycosyltransferase involved in cell wall biosynthesis
MKPLIVVPVYNHSQTLRDIVSRVLRIHSHVMVVDDGCTDGGIETLNNLNIHMVRHDQNRGKGVAIMSAVREARNLGMTHLITIDADGQHDPADLPLFLSKIEQAPDAIIVGTRNFAGAPIPFSSRFGRSFSNFWLRVQTGRSLKDTQSGFRAYPIAVLEWLRLREKHYSFEIEVLVKAAWAGIELKEVDISVHYPEGPERISHFRPFMDNARLSLLNTRLTMRAIAPVPHRRFMPVTAESEKITILHPLRSLRRLIKRDASPRQLAASATLGVFLGSLPLIACQTISILTAANFLRLNKIVALTAGQLCMPPLVPALCIELGHFIRHGRFLTEISLKTIGVQSLQRLYEWMIGSFILGPILAVATGSVIYVIASLIQKENDGT